MSDSGLKMTRYYNLVLTIKETQRHSNEEKEALDQKIPQYHKDISRRVCKIKIK